MTQRLWKCAGKDSCENISILQFAIMKNLITFNKFKRMTLGINSTSGWIHSPEIVVEIRPSRKIIAPSRQHLNYMSPFIAKSIKSAFQRNDNFFILRSFFRHRHERSSVFGSLARGNFILLLKKQLGGKKEEWWG